MENSDKNKKKWVDKCLDTLKLAGRSEKTRSNYKSALIRFLNFYDVKTNIKNLNEDDIINYIQEDFIKKNRAGDTYNLNICAIRYMYSICFDKELNKKKLPSVKLKKRLPTIISKNTFINIVNNELVLKHKCWLLLAFCSGLRVNEVANIRIENIYSNEHKLKVLGKGNKERYTILPDVVIKYLRLYYSSKNMTEKNGYLFTGTNNNEHINSNTIINYFSTIKKLYNLDNNITFHCLRHSFATYYLMNGGNILTLQSMLGHKSLYSTTIYIHLSRNFNNLEGIKYV